MERITSAHNPTLKLARKLLKSGRERERSGMILLDGIHLVSDYAKRFGLSGAVILLDEAATRTAEINAVLAGVATDTKRCEVATSAFRALSPVDTPTGIVALCPRPMVTNGLEQPDFNLLLDGIQDPGNLGSILRTAAATGVDSVILSATCADAWSPRCLRGGMGAQFTLPVSKVPNVGAVASGFAGRVIATSSHQGLALMDADLSGPALVMFGGEGTGLQPELIAIADATLRIPLRSDIESLNVGAAVAMTCYERMRQAGS